MPLTLRSPAFVASGDIPAVYTCDADGVSPPLQWEQLPVGTRSLVLIVDDPGAGPGAGPAPERLFTHWTVYDLPPAAGRLDEAASPGGLPDPAREVRNDLGGRGWTPPCPPAGRHQYHFRLYALDAELGDLGPEAGRYQVEQAMQGHVIEHAELVASYGPRGA